MTKKINNWIIGLFTALAASLCCITPVLAFIGGASGLATSFSWVEPYRPYFICLTVVVFVFLWYQKLNPIKQIDCVCDVPNRKSFWQSKLFLAFITLIATLLIAFPYYTKIFYPKPQITTATISNSTNISKYQLSISEMNCEGCEEHINGELLKVIGVIEVNTSYKNAGSIVKFDNTITSVDSLISIINKIGYKVVSANLIKK